MDLTNPDEVKAFIETELPEYVILAAAKVEVLFQIISTGVSLLLKPDYPE